MIKLGLTGGIGMGKSTVANMFAQHGIPSFNADEVVHALQAPNGGALPALAKEFPDLVTGGILNRAGLRALVLADSNKMRALEQIMHPMVHSARADFLKSAQGKKAVLLDIPLLFETKAQAEFEKIIVVSCPRDIQISRVLQRGLKLDEIEAIIARQMPDLQKRSMANYIIETGGSLASTEAQINTIIKELDL